MQTLPVLPSAEQEAGLGLDFTKKEEVGEWRVFT
jgi:hypothetical protein